MKNILIAAVAAGSLLSLSANAGPSAKFAATYNDETFPLALVSLIDSAIQPSDCNSADGFTLATIKVPQDKELLVGVSAEVLLVTDTSVKGKAGGSARAVAYSAARVTVGACPVDEGPSDACVVAAPGGVTLNDRIQVLDATLGGALTDCTDANGDGIISVDECTLTDEEIGLVLDTLSSHHFNFVLPDMNQGEYDIVALFGTEACNDISSDGDAEAMAFAVAGIGKYMLTVQQVRATKNGIIDAEIEEL
ncbi:MAG: hypothetical protein HKO99_11345 [Xanthomonadales bacterium]|nr:hypothetical protein [Gammaproteobacteria bacterium]NNK52180.1 hypothetical protein [Xanthomonadales bacterium]